MQENNLQIQELKAEYAKMIEQCKERCLFKGKKNIYTCIKCHNQTVTIDIDQGATPFGIKCEHCGSFAQSSFYNSLTNTPDATHEWYRPAIEEVIKMHKSDDKSLEHVMSGGLLRRMIGVAKRELNGGFYWVRYNNKGWTIGEYDKSIDQWFIPGHGTSIEWGWIDEVGERVKQPDTESKQSELKKALGDKIKELKGSETNLQSQVERVAIAFALDQLNYLNEIVEYE